MAQPLLQGVMRQIEDLAGRREREAMSDAELLDGFCLRREETLFAALMRRHGAMVLGVARRVLTSTQDAEDVFQATFLLLARKAGQIRKHRSIAGWLYEVARRLSLKSRAQSVSRSKRERIVASMPNNSTNVGTAWSELHEVLDQALLQLPEKYRSVLVLCYLEGRTQEEVAKLLACPLGTVRSRLAQARNLLRARLAKHGFKSTGEALTALLVTVAAGQPAEATLYHQTLTAAVAAASGNSVAGVVSAGAARLFAIGLRSMAVTKLKVVIALALGASFCLGGTAAVAYSFLRPSPERTGPDPFTAGALPPEPSTARMTPEQEPEVRNKTIAISISGRVLGADGKPVGGARVALVDQPHSVSARGDLSHPLAWIHTTADAKGRFHFKLERSKTTRYRNFGLVVRANGHALGVKELNPILTESETVIRLAAEDLIRGRLVDLQGQPAAGVKVHISSVGKGDPGEVVPLSFWDPPKDEIWPAPATTDAEGRFVLSVVNRNQGVALQVRDERFARAMFSISEQDAKPEMTATLAPAQIIEGRILAADTGIPIPHAHFTVYASDQDDFFLGAGVGMEGNADAEGRFHANPFAGKAFTVTAYPPTGQPYLAAMSGFKWPKGNVRHQVDVRLPRGVLVRGKVTEVGSAAPVGETVVQYIPRRDNPNQREEIITGWQGATVTGPDGVFQTPVIPGKGHLLFRSSPDFVPIEVSSGQLDDIGQTGQRLYPHALAALDLQVGQPTKEVTVSLQRGVSVHGRILGLDNQPVQKAVMVHRLDGISETFSWRHAVEIRDGQFEVRGLAPSQSIPVYFLEPEKRWGATIEISSKDAGKDVTVRLVPCAQASARYVDSDGQPVSNQALILYVVVTPGRALRSRGQGLSADEDFINNIDRHNYWNPPRPDKNGRIVFPALIPGAIYRLYRVGKEGLVVHKEFSVESGKTIDLGTVVVEQGH
jgi:RNA polymerase sigma factor (sigma-70 family)